MSFIKNILEKLNSNQLSSFVFDFNEVKESWDTCVRV